MSDNQPAETPKPCSSPEARQFEFWIGEWDLTWGQDQHGTNTIHADYDGCVIYEQFNGAPSSPLKGMSISTYDAQRKQWRQTWVDNQGSYIDLAGAWADGQMVLVNHTEIEGKPVQFRMVFRNIHADALDWDWERSDDGGQTWEPRWQIHYTRKT